MRMSHMLRSTQLRLILVGTSQHLIRVPFKGFLGFCGEQPMERMVTIHKNRREC